MTRLLTSVEVAGVAPLEEIPSTRDRRWGDRVSGGQQQRLCIARALAVSPEVILMDEPCSALDPISTLAIEDLITGRRQYPIVMVTHNLQQAARVSDVTAFLTTDGPNELGRLVEVGPTAQLFDRPANPGHRALPHRQSG